MDITAEQSTMFMMDLLVEKLEHAESFHYPVTMIRARRVDPLIDEDRPSHSDQSSYYSEHDGIGIRVKSMLDNGSLSCIVIPRRPVDEVSEEKEVSSEDQEMASAASIEKSIATERRFGEEHEMFQVTKISSGDRILQRTGDQTLEGFTQDREQQLLVVLELVEQLEEVPTMVSGLSSRSSTFSLWSSWSEFPRGSVG